MAFKIGVAGGRAAVLGADEQGLFCIEGRFYTLGQLEKLLRAHRTTEEGIRGVLLEDVDDANGDFMLSIRTRNCIKACGVEHGLPHATVGDLLDYFTKDMLSKTADFGKKSRDELYTLLSSHGLALPDDEPAKSASSYFYYSDI